MTKTIRTPSAPIVAEFSSFHNWFIMFICMPFSLNNNKTKLKDPFTEVPHKCTAMISTGRLILPLQQRLYIDGAIYMDISKTPTNMSQEMSI